MISDVEKILIEMRERVLAEETAPSLAATPEERALITSSPAVVPNEVLDRIVASLSVTGRAWDRLPPVFSARRGLPARMERWIKNSFKPLTRWFTWEQINFNSAVHHALSDVLAALRAQREEALARNQQLEGIERELHALRSLLETQAQELQRLQSAHAKDRAEVQIRFTETDAALAGFHDKFRSLEQMVDEFREDRGEELRAELREGHRNLAQEIAKTAHELREEQRVCFKQLSLEASEAAILEDRGRRALEARLEKLENRNSR